MKQKTLVTVIFSSVLVGSQLHAAVTITAIGDTSVAGTEQTHTARGLTTSVQISDNGASNRHKGYFLFNLSAHTSTPGFADLPATFTVNFLGTGSGTGTGQAFALRGLNSGFTGTTNWNESTVVPSTAPANADFSDFTSGATTQIATRAFTLYTFSGAADFTIGRIGDYLQSDGTLTLMLVGTTGNQNRNHFVGSSNNSTASLRPSLTFVPEPSTFVLTAFSSLLLFRRRRL
jgi:hypothetical protein